MDDGLGTQTNTGPRETPEGTQAACRRLCSEAMFALFSGAIGHAGRLAQEAVERSEDQTLLGDTRVAVRLSTLRTAASVSEASGSLAEAWSYVEQAIVVAASGSRDLTPMLYSLQVKSADLLCSMNRYKEAESRWASAIVPLAESTGELRLQLDARLSYGAFLRQQARPQESYREVIIGLGLLPRMDRAEGAEICAVLMKHAVQMGEDSCFRDAAHLSGEALRRLKDCLSAVESSTAKEFLSDVSVKHAEFLVKAGRVGEGRLAYEAQLRDFSENCEPIEPKLMQLRDTMSLLEAELGNFERAHTLARENLDLAIEAGENEFEKIARVRISSIFLMQGRRRDAYEIVADMRADDEPVSEEAESGYQPDDEREEVSLDEALEMADGLPMPAKVLRKADVLAERALAAVGEDPEEALDLVNRAEDELSVLAPGLTTPFAKSLSKVRAAAMASLGGVPGLIKFQERKIAEFEKVYGCSAEMTRHDLLSDLAELHIHNGNDEAAEELLTQIKEFLERRQATGTLLYGTTLMRLADVVNDQAEAERLRSDGEQIIESFREQTDFE